MTELPARPRRFFYAFSTNRPPPHDWAGQIKHDEPFTDSQLHAMGVDKGRREILYKRELTGRWRDATLSEIFLEFERRRRDNTLPADNMTPPPKKPAPGRPAA